MVNKVNYYREGTAYDPFDPQNLNLSLQMVTNEFSKKDSVPFEKHDKEYQDKINHLINMKAAAIK